MQLLLDMLTVPTVLAALFVISGLVYSHITGRPLVVFHSGKPPALREGDETDEDIQEFVTLESMQGVWRMASVGRNGNFAPEELVDEASILMKIEDDRFWIGDTESAGRIRIRNHVLPTQMDQLADGEVSRCIVRFRNNGLEIFQAESGKRRPKTFTPVQYNGASLATFARVSDSSGEF